MSYEPPDRSEPRSAGLRRTRSSFISIVGLLAVSVALSGCASLQVRPVRAEKPSAQAPAPAESSALPDAPERDVEEPPTSSAEPSPSPTMTRVLVVKASAYNSLRSQTDSTPNIAAWGDRLRPGMKVIAVSRDLLALGLRRGQRVRIEGLDGEFVVLDRMPSRWHRKIDIYMGNDVRAARNWGVREVEIHWEPGPGDPGFEEAFEAAGGVVETAN